MFFTVLILTGLKANGQSLDDITFGTDTTFEVITWNLEWFPKNGSITVDSVSKVIEAMDVDLIGLQEIDDSSACREMIDNLEDYELFMDNDWFGGLAYIYKTSTIELGSIYKIYDTAPYWNAFPRSPLVIELEFMGEEFIVINNHFKCCGDGDLELGNSSDEENRRYEASSHLKEYIDLNFAGKRVMVIGDLNDVLTDVPDDNVFQMFLDDPLNYRFADQSIAEGSSSNWSFPGWPSHLDHILVTNEVFTELDQPESLVETIRVDDFLPGGFDTYDTHISDHRPVGLKLEIVPTFSNNNELKIDPVAVFPNPSSNGNFQILINDQSPIVTLQVLTASGEIIFSESNPTNQPVELQLNQEPGLYFLRVQFENAVSIKKLIIST